MSLFLKHSPLSPCTAWPSPAASPSSRTSTFQIKPGSLFPALHRLQEAGWLSADWGESENNRRAKFYRLTKLGHRQLRQETANWSRISAAMSGALEIP